MSEFIAPRDGAEAEYVQELMHFALTHGIVYGMKTPAADATGGRVDINPKAHSVHAPITLRPYEYPRSAYEKSQRLTTVFNTLYAK
jgi:hypothetical protein